MKNKAKRMEYSSKPDKCPLCGFVPVATIIYGYYVHTPELRRKFKEGLLLPGGCCVSGDEPSWMCTRCGQEFYSIDSYLRFRRKFKKFM